MSKENMQIIIASHKKCDVPSDVLYLPLHVGAKGKDSIGFQRDDEGDNISEKNPLFCELTGIYWAWKNLNCDYVGLAHYRRYFTMKSKNYQKKNGELNSVLTYAELSELLKNNYKVFVPKKRNYYIETIYKHYSHTFSEDHLLQTKAILDKKYPEYNNAWNKVMNSTSAYVFNMFIMNKVLFNDYCEWLFDILFELEKRIDVSNMTDFEKRYIGRVSERLFNVWLEYKIEKGDIKREEIKELPYLYMGKVDWGRKITSFLAAKLFNKKYDKSF